MSMGVSDIEQEKHTSIMALVAISEKHQPEPESLLIVPLPPLLYCNLRRTFVWFPRSMHHQRSTRSLFAVYSGEYAMFPVSFVAMAVVLIQDN